MFLSKNHQILKNYSSKIKRWKSIAQFITLWIFCTFLRFLKFFGQFVGFKNMRNLILLQFLKWNFGGCLLPLVYCFSVIFGNIALATRIPEQYNWQLSISRLKNKMTIKRHHIIFQIKIYSQLKNIKNMFRKES